MTYQKAIQCKKTTLQNILSADYQFILQNVFEGELITLREYNNLKVITKDVEESTISLVDKIMNKGEGICKRFLQLLERDDIKNTFPSLEEIEWNSPPSEPCYATEDDCYPLTHNPRGKCVIINNELFLENRLTTRTGTQKDEKALSDVFSSLGFVMEVHNNKTAEEIQNVVHWLGKQDFSKVDVLVVCVLSHGEMGCVFGTDGKKVFISDLTRPFTGSQAPSLAGKPKLFFIQACQVGNHQEAPFRASLQTGEMQGRLEGDAGPIQRGAIAPLDADFLIGMSTLGGCISFRNTRTGSIYIQELCKQLEAVVREEDILTVLTRVNREVSKNGTSYDKQIPEPRYTLTKKLILNRLR